MLEAQQACTAGLMSLTGSGSTWVGGGLLYCMTEIGISVQKLACHLVVGVGCVGWAPVGLLSDQLHIGRFLCFQVCTVYNSG